MLAASPPEPEDALFHCQQAVEKTFKGFLVWHDQPLRKIHDLGKLGRHCVGIDATLESLVDRAASLTEYAWSFRYPGEETEASPEEARDCLAAPPTPPPAAAP